MFDKFVLDDVKAFLLNPFYDSYYWDESGNVNIFVSLSWKGEMQNVNFDLPTASSIVTEYNGCVYQSSSEFWKDFINDKETFGRVCCELCWELNKELRRLERITNVPEVSCGFDEDLIGLDGYPIEREDPFVNACFH